MDEYFAKAIAKIPKKNDTIPRTPMERFNVILPAKNMVFCAFVCYNIMFKKKRIYNKKRDFASISGVCISS